VHKSGDNLWISFRNFQISRSRWFGKANCKILVMQLRIRQATLEDLGAMLEWRGHSKFMREAIMYEFGSITRGETVVFLAFAATKLAGIELVGTVQLVRGHDDPDLMHDAAYLQGLEVRETFRRQGLAGRLIARLEDQARLDGRGRVTVMIEPDNDLSLAFFENLGYQVFKHSSFVWAGESLPVVCLEKSIRSKIV
jgi:ribosomal protein S18 acetylase RimI-like enzyme